MRLLIRLANLYGQADPRNPRCDSLGGKFRPCYLKEIPLIIYKQCIYTIP